MQQFEIVGMQLSGANITIEHKTIGGTLQVDNKELERAVMFRARVSCTESEVRPGHGAL